MPYGDRTGPLGFGAMTGRAAGYCAGHPVPGYMNPAGGRAPLWGRGRGRGWRRMYYATGLPGWARFGYGAGFPAAPVPPAPYAGPFGPVGPGGEPDDEAEFAALKEQAEFLKTQLDEVQARIGELQEGTEDKPEEE